MRVMPASVADASEARVFASVEKSMPDRDTVTPYEPKVEDLMKRYKI